MTQTHFILQKREFLMYTIVGGVMILLLGVIVGLKLTETTTGNIRDNDVTNLLFQEMKASNIKANLRYFAGNTHIAGSKQEEEILVVNIVNRWKKELDKVTVYPYDVMLSMPNATNPNYVAIMDKDEKIIYKSSILECNVSETNCENVVPNFNAYGHKGHVEANMVFVNYASNNDFSKLIEYGITPKGKICIAKYGKMWRGDKSKNAESHGCLGLILYPDPIDFADYDKTKDVYPDTWFMPPKGTQKGSILQVDGDPLTPFYPSIPSAFRFKENEVKLPKIPVHPINYEDAKLFLSKIGGPIAPKSWWGKLSLTYRLGGDLTPKFVLNVGNERPIKTIRNVIGYLYGSHEPDRYIILGNHRDAWDFGAIDPSSATAVMMEVARAMGELTKNGIWRPKRTIVFCSWAAEEYGFIGSTEWVEQMEKILFLRAVAYFNIDLAVQGNATLGAMGTPNLQTALINAAKKVPNPDASEIALGRPTVFDTWLHYDPDKKRPHLPKIRNLGSGSDYLMFLQKVGVSSLDFWYTYDEVNSNMAFYPIYHSAFENVHYFESFLDPEYKISLAVGQLWAEIAKMFADDVILPFSPTDYGYALKEFISSLLHDYESDFRDNNLKVDYDYLHEAVVVFEIAVHKFEQKILSAEKSDSIMMRMLNDKLMYFDRFFLDMEGLFDQPYYRHLVFAPNADDSYSSSELPGIMSAIYATNKTGSWLEVSRQMSYLTSHILSAATAISDF